MRETVHKPLGLCSFANARRTDENDASGAFEFLSGHSKAVCRVAEREEGQLLRRGGDLGLRSSKLLGDILQPHVEIIVKICTYVQSEM